MHSLFIMLALLAGATVSESHEQFDVKYTAWNWACELTVDCAGLSPPDVIYMNLGKNLRGEYRGGKSILVHSRLVGLDQMSTVIHEMIHYIDKQHGVEIPGPPRGICTSENRAFTLVDQWWELQGYPQFKRGPDWWKAYWHCMPYYDPNWELWGWLALGFAP